MPNQNGWGYQTNKFLEAMTFIDAEITKHNEQVNINGRK